MEMKNLHLTYVTRVEGLPGGVSFHLTTENFIVILRSYTKEEGLGANTSALQRGSDVIKETA